ncbi:MAG TPA: cell filamentation protein Fic [Clostridiales bacterium]|nr:cell filamentation protein Fic [Clostridiales bacterium]
MSDIVMYQTEDGLTKIEVEFENDTAWLNVDQMSELFQKAKSTVREHILNIYEEGELSPDDTMRKIGNSDFSTKPTNFYSLDVIISVGYRVKSIRGTQFRIWANGVLKEYLRKGFAMNDDLLKQAGGGGYFKELLERIRDIRSSEKVFYRQILDLFATSEDYNANSPEAAKLFKVIQNKMHWATHGHTASELIFERADSNKPFMGLTTFKGKRPIKSEVDIAKNYLTEQELGVLNRLVSAYLDLAEIKALRGEKMKMRDWLVQIDAFLTMTRSEVLNSAGTVSQIEAQAKAEAEYIKYKNKSIDELTAVERDFLLSLKQTQKKLENKTKK